jgi:hypothetical protein
MRITVYMGFVLHNTFPSKTGQRRTRKDNMQATRNYSIGFVYLSLACFAEKLITNEFDT